jgi:ABC-type nitrate/sulfonate/bicarbonate transport system substrate-binding protein
MISLIPNGILEDDKNTERTFMHRTTNKISLPTLLVFAVFISSAHAATKMSFPFTPISAASLPWWIAKEARFYEKYNLE